MKSRKKNIKRKQHSNAVRVKSKSANHARRIIIRKKEEVAASVHEINVPMMLAARAGRGDVGVELHITTAAGKQLFLSFLRRQESRGSGSPIKSGMTKNKYRMTGIGILQSLFTSAHKKRMAGSMVAALLIGLIVSTPLLLAFEAHVINVTAEIFNIDPPTITPPGGEYSAPIDVMLTDDDPDATHIFYTITPGSDASLAPDPMCGVSAGGAKPRGPIALSSDSVIKAIACDSDVPSAHASIIATAIYIFVSPFGKIEGHKYHDFDKSGTLTLGDQPIDGWHIDLKDTGGVVVASTTVTDAAGYYIFTDINPGDYTVVEEDRDGWDHITLSSVGVTIAGGDTHLVNFFNFDTGFACVPQSISFPSNLAVQAGGTLTSNDDINVASNVVINGDVRSNDEIEKIGGGSNRTINGNATAASTIDTGFIITGTTATSAAVVSLPDVMIPTWKARAQDGGTVNGSFTFPNNTVGLVLGPTEIMGNVTFGSSNGVTIKGPIHIHGNLVVGSNTNIVQDFSFGNQFSTIIVDGKIDIASNITFTGASTTGTFLLISTQAAVAGDDAAIETSSNNSDLGDVVLYASDGDIHINSNRTLLAAFAAHGTGDDSDDNGAIRLDSNVTVNYRALPDKVSCGARQPYESTSHILINEFIPNPAGTGTDQGGAGAPLDGEWVELFNPTTSSIDVAGYVLYDSVNTHALSIVAANTNTGGTIVPSGGYLVVYRDGDTDFELNNAGGDTVRLFSDLIGSGGVLIDSHAYVRDAPDDKSFARVPDGSANWIDPDSTPGEPNRFFFEPIGDGSTPAFEPSEKPMLVIEEEIPAIVETTMPSADDVVYDISSGASTTDIIFEENSTTSSSTASTTPESTDTTSNMPIEPSDQPQSDTQAATTEILPPAVTTEETAIIPADMSSSSGDGSGGPVPDTSSSGTSDTSAPAPTPESAP